MDQTPIPFQAVVLTGDLQSLITNYLLMKLGGQVVLSCDDLAQLSREYAGYFFKYDAALGLMKLTSRTRDNASTQEGT